MPKKTTQAKLKIPKMLKAMGAFDVKQNGKQIEVLMDPSKMPENIREKIAPGFTSSAGGAMFNNPTDATFFMMPYNYLKANPHEKIKMAMNYFNTEPLVGKIIELMKIFSIDGFKNECSDPKIKSWYDNWCDAVDMELVLSWIFLEYYRSGNVTTVRELISYKEDKLGLDAPEYSTGEGSASDLVDGSVLDSAHAAAKKDYAKKSIPIAYSVLNPLTVYVSNINGWKDDLFLRTNEAINTNAENDHYNLILQEVPKDLGEVAKKAGVLPLSSKNTRRILRMRQPYEAYGHCLMERAFNPLFEKNKLRQLDMSMANSSINQILKVTVGDENFPATQRQVKAIAAAFQNAGKGEAIFWNHTLKIELIKADMTILNKEKYYRVDEDIRTAFGISEILTGASSAKTSPSTSYLALKAFVANIREGRRDISRWLLQEYKDIAQAMGFKTYPNPTFDSLYLGDEVAEKQLILQMIDRGIISYESAQNALGFDPGIEVIRKRREKADVQNGILGPAVLAGQQQTDAMGNPVKPKGKPQPIVSSKPNAKDSQNNVKNKKAKKIKKSATDGRPKTPVGAYPAQRKQARMKAKGNELLEQIGELEQPKFGDS